MAARSPSTVQAAGCVVWRYGSTEPEVLLVHRPRWDDLSFPKGKVARGELLSACAVREVEEETAVRVSLGPRLHDQHYTLNNGQPKVVSYWCGLPPRLADVSRHVPNDEIDTVRWVSLSKARRKLSYPRDVDLLDQFVQTTFDSSVLLVLRHADARKRRTWRGPDMERPLTAVGSRAASRLAPALAAYGITRVVSSDAARCVDTVLPFVNASHVKLRLDSGLSEEGMSTKRLATIAADALASDKRMAICTHRPVLPKLCAALGISEVTLEPGALLVIHRTNGQIASVEKPD